MARPLQIPYGIADFKRIREEGYCYVDKTAYIRTLEEFGSFLFLVRPRRFGKSLFIDMMSRYYDVNEKANFEKYFGGLQIAANPTENANRYLVLRLDFSHVGFMPAKTLEEKFEQYMDVSVRAFVNRYRSHLPGLDEGKVAGAGALFQEIVNLEGRQLPIYLFIDEYDNFTNQLAISNGGAAYRAVTHGNGFYRNWFKGFKSACERIFMTGVSPVTMDDLTSGFNIATNISTESAVNSMLGFSEEEVMALYASFKGVGKFTEGDPVKIVQAIKPWYDGYCFANEKIGQECVYNSDMSLRYLLSLVTTGRPPHNLVDPNVATDYSKLRQIAELDRGREGSDLGSMTEVLATKGEMTFNLVESFPFEQLMDPANLHSLVYYYGIVTMKARKRGATYFGVPNVCVERQLFSYLRSAYKRTNAPDWLVWDELATSFAYDGEWKPFLERLATDYAATTPVRGGLQGEIRVQGYMQAEFGHLRQYLLAPEMELARGFCDFALFPERTDYWDVAHSYLIELKFSAANADEAELAAKREEAVAQLARYRQDGSVPTLAKGTTLHQIVYQFKGAECVRMEEIAKEEI